LTAQGEGIVATFESCEQIEAWKKARQLSQEIYALTREGQFGRDYALRDQIRRACVSVMANIAEGFERSGTNEFVQFLAIAKGSVGEIRAQLYIAYDQGYVTEDVFMRLAGEAQEIGKMTGGLIRYLRGSGIKGAKYARKRGEDG
jgi:four helix bundle protein